MVTMTAALAMLFTIVIVQVIQIIANPLEQSRNETMDLWNLGEPDNCPPFPNCAPGYTCWVYQHPNNCPVCECVACGERSCIPRPGELCRWSKHSRNAAECGTCYCEPCPASPTSCQPGCRRVVSHSGCTFCKCPHFEKEISTR
ncbi:BPTI/Kunitz domain-containing protein 4-like, partial [Varroa jacobsoni]